jgi:hypothetical protein
MSALPVFRVRFYKSRCYEVALRAASEEQAITAVEAFWLRGVAIPAARLVEPLRLDSSDDFEDASAEEVQP